MDNDPVSNRSYRLMIARAPGAASGLARAHRQRHHPAMPRLIFTSQLRRFLDVPEVVTEATTLRGALAEAFAAHPRLRGYVVDEQGHLRANVVAFIDGERCDDRVNLTQPLAATSVVHVMQALSGG
jgi:hypothetical protein